MDAPTDRPHILLSSMGTGKPGQPPDRSGYSIGDAQCDCRFSAVALWKLLPAERRPDEIWYLLTPEARAYAESHIVDEARQAAVPVTFVDLLGNDAADDSRAFLEIVAAGLPQGCRLTLDVTRGLRHHAFLFYALALYLSEFRDITIDGAWYCRFEIAQDPSVPRPFIDLKPVLDLARWFHALAVFRETGSLQEVSDLLPVGNARNNAAQLSRFFLTGMPLEAGDAASKLLRHAESSSLLPDIPLASEIQAAILDEVRPLAGPEFITQSSGSGPSKKAIELTEQELARQAAFIDRYFRTGQLNLAFGLLREWTVNLFAHVPGEATDWLDRRVRETIEHKLGGLGEVLKGKLDDSYRHASVRDQLTESQRQWAKRWNRLCELRNTLQHHGMRAEVFQPERRDIRNAEADWQQHDQWQRSLNCGGGNGRLLICPIGLTPGVLFSAIRHTRPDRALVICSNDSSAAIDQAIAKAGGSVEIMRLAMANAFTGIEEFEALTSQASLWLFSADEIHANLTGGTTLMGVLVGALAKRGSREYQREVREFVLIDKRPPEAQRSDPWQLGEIHYLDRRFPPASDGSPPEAERDENGPPLDPPPTTRGRP